MTMSLSILKGTNTIFIQLIYFDVLVHMPMALEIWDSNASEYYLSDRMNPLSSITGSIFRALTFVNSSCKCSPTNISGGYCMVCASVFENNPQAIALTGATPCNYLLIMPACS